MVHENLGGINGQDGFDKLETSEIDNSLLMSFIDEFQMEEEGIECDDERLMSVIQSLQAEIDPFLLEGHDSSEEIEWDENWTSNQISNGHHMDHDQDCSTTTSDGLDHFNWMEMDDVSASYMECHDDEIAHLRGVSNYSQMCYGVVPFEEQGYASLWQETYAPFV